MRVVQWLCLRVLLCIIILILPALAISKDKTNDKAYMGLDISSIQPRDVNRLGLASAEGVLIIRVVKKSPVDKCGLQVDDVLVKINDAEIKSQVDFSNILSKCHSGEKATLTFTRNGETHEVDLVFGSPPKLPKAKKLSYNKNKEKQITQLLDVIDTNNKSMGSLAIANNKQLLFTRALGYKLYQDDNQYPADVNTKYRIGSISKMFTAVMVFQLIEERKLSPQTKLSDFFPQIPNAKVITINMMLTHQSGIFSFTEMPDYLTWSTQKRSHDEIIDRITGFPAAFNPGAKHEYSNSNYLLLGYIIEQLDKQDYAVSLQSRICERIGLKNTYYGGKMELANNEASSYLYLGYWEKGYETDMSVPGGAGAIVSTASDLVLFCESLFSGELISNQSLKQMVREEDGFGSGIFKMPLGNQTYYGHTGSIDNFHSILWYSPKDKHAIAYLSNGEADPTLSVIALVSLIMADRIVKMPQYLKADQLGDIDRYVGTYSNQEIQMRIAVTVKDRDLYTQGEGQPAIRLDPIDERKFTCLNLDLEIEFQPDGKSFTLKQAGSTYVFQRVE
jgi:CubicO group peptidase (beta-lactamase class C family)